MLSSICNKSYADADFIALKKDFGDFFAFPKACAPKLNLIRDVLKNWYGENYDIQMAWNYDLINLTPYFIIRYPELEITNADHDSFTLHGLMVKYSLMFNDDFVGISSEISLFKTEYSTKELLVNYTHSHVSREVYNMMAEYLKNTIRYRKASDTKDCIIDYNKSYHNVLCLGNDDVRFMFSDLLCEESEIEKAYTYFFGYMDNLLKFENTVGAYPGQTIHHVKNASTKNDNYKIVSNIGHQRTTNHIGLYDRFNLALFDELAPYIDTLHFTGNKIRIATFKNGFDEFLLELTRSNAPYWFTKVYELDQEYYMKNPYRSNNIENVRLFVEFFNKSAEQFRIGYRFRDDLIPLDLTFKIKEDDITELYKEVVHPMEKDNIISFLNFNINRICYEKLFSEANKPAVKNCIKREVCTT